MFQIAFSSIKLDTSLCGSEEGQPCTEDLSERFQTWIILESFRCYGRWQRHPSLTCKEYQVDVCIYKSLIFLSFFPFPLFLEEQMLIAVFRQSLGCVSHNSQIPPEPTHNRYTATNSDNCQSSQKEMVGEFSCHRNLLGTVSTMKIQTTTNF